MVPASPRSASGEGGLSNAAAAAAAAAATTPANNNNNNNSMMRPPMMRKQSSQSSHSSRHVAAGTNNTHLTSPGGSATEHHNNPLQRHHVKPARHTKIVLARNHSSARNLTKLPSQRHQVQYAEDGRKHARQRSHEGDTEIRLPGSLDESVQSTNSKPPMRRNMTAQQLPRNSSHAKLKKNLSHGQLTRSGSTKNLAHGVGSGHAHGTTLRAPPSPGLRGKSKRPKSAEMTGVEMDLHEQEVELYMKQQEQQKQRHHQRKGSAKKVGFAVGSAGDTSDDDAPEMDGSGLQEDEWTEESASASPYSTRQNTANNSRRTSMVVNQAAEKLPRRDAPQPQQEMKTADEPASGGTSASTEEGDDEEEEDDEDEDESTAGSESEAPSPITMASPKKEKEPQTEQTKQMEKIQPPIKREPPQEHQKAATNPPPTTQDFAPQPVPPKQPAPRSPLYLAKEHKNPTTERLLDKSQQLPAPALVSNVSAMDDTHSSRGSPAPSMRSSGSNIRDGQEDELVSRFVPSASHPSTGSGTATAVGTPKQNSGFHTPEESNALAAQQRLDRSMPPTFAIGPVSPGSILSAGSSGATTPSAVVGRSRTELRMLQEKAMADMESQADTRPHLPAHVYDRRNESLKSYNGNSKDGQHGHGVSGSFASGEAIAAALSMGPDVFQGRFRALNTELRVVQKFRDPIGEAVVRLRGSRGSRIYQRGGQHQQPAGGGGGGGLPVSRSAVSLPAAAAARNRVADLAKSASPPERAAALALKRGQSAAVMGNSSQSHQPQQQGAAAMSGSMVGSGGGGGGAAAANASNSKQRREVSFARAPPETREFVPGEEELAPDMIVRRMWEGV